MFGPLVSLKDGARTYATARATVNPRTSELAAQPLTTFMTHVMIAPSSSGPAPRRKSTAVARTPSTRSRENESDDICGIVHRPEQGERHMPQEQLKLGKQEAKRLKTDFQFKDFAESIQLPKAPSRF